MDEPWVIRLPGIGGRIERDELRRRTREVDDGPLGGEGEDARCYKRAAWTGPHGSGPVSALVDCPRRRRKPSQA